MRTIATSQSVQAAEEGAEVDGSLGGHGVPRSDPRVVHTLLGVHTVGEDIHGHAVAEGSVGAIALGYGLLVSRPVEGDDLLVLHLCLLLSGFGGGPPLPL